MRQRFSVLVLVDARLGRLVSVQNLPDNGLFLAQ